MFGWVTIPIDGCREYHKVKAPEKYPYCHGCAHLHQQRSIHNSRQGTILSLHKSSVATIWNRRVDATTIGALPAKYEHCCMALYGFWVLEFMGSPSCIFQSCELDRIGSTDRCEQGKCIVKTCSPVLHICCPPPGPACICTHINKAG